MFAKENSLNYLKKLPVWLRHPFISAGLEPVLSHTVKSCIADKFLRILE